MTKILITGNSGYIGSHLSKILLKDKNLILHGLDIKKPKIDLHKQIVQDILHTDWNLTEDYYDCVIHLAAKVSVSESTKNPILYYGTNTLGTLNLLNNIKTKRLVVASTGAADGVASPYGISKRAMEEIVNQFCEENNIPFTIFRFYNVIGTDGIEPTNPDGLFFSLISSMTTKKFVIFGNDYNTADGTCIRDYTHVNEICYSIIKSIEHSSNQIENLGHGIGTSVKEIVDIFKSVNNCNFEILIGPRRAGDLEFSVLSNPSKYMEKMYTIEQLLKVNK